MRSPATEQSDAGLDSPLRITCKAHTLYLEGTEKGIFFVLTRGTQILASRVQQKPFLQFYVHTKRKHQGFTKSCIKKQLFNDQISAFTSEKL